MIASMDTRPCLRAVWRRRWRVSLLSSAGKPAGSQQQAGVRTPSALSRARGGESPVEVGPVGVASSVGVVGLVGRAAVAGGAGVAETLAAGRA